MTDPASPKPQKGNAMTKPAKTKGKAGVDKPVLTDEIIHENGKPVGHIALSGDMAEGGANGK